MLNRIPGLWCLLKSGAPGALLSPCVPNRRGVKVMSKESSLREYAFDLIVFSLEGSKVFRKLQGVGFSRLWGCTGFWRPPKGSAIQALHLCLAGGRLCYSSAIDSAQCPGTMILSKGGKHESYKRLTPHVTHSAKRKPLNHSLFQMGALRNVRKILGKT